MRPTSFLFLSLFAAACNTAGTTSKDDFDPTTYGTGASEAGGDTTTAHTSVSVTIEQGYCAVYEWKLDGDVVTRMSEEVLSSPRSFTGDPGSMMEVDCSNSYVAPQIEPISSWSTGCVVNMVCDGATEDDICDHDDVWYYIIPSSETTSSSQCYEGSETGRG